MIFVRLAIGKTSSGRRRHSTSPVSTSNTSPARGGLRNRTWKASTPPSGTSGTGSASISGAGSRGSSGAPATGGEPTASGGLDVPPDAPSWSSETHATAATPAGAARMATIAISPGSRERRRPPWSTGRGERGGGPPLAIRRWRGERTQHPDAEQGQDDHGDHDEDIDPPLHRDGDRQKGEQADDHQAAHEGECSAHQYTGIRCGWS